MVSGGTQASLEMRTCAHVRTQTYDIGLLWGFHARLQPVVLVAFLSATAAAALQFVYSDDGCRSEYQIARVVC